MPGRRLDLGIDAGLAASAEVHALDQLDLLGERRDLKARRAAREAAGKNLLAVLVGALHDRQRLQLVEREIDRVEAAIGPRPVGKHLRHVGHGVDLDVVQHHRHAVLAEHDVLLDVVGAHGVRGRLGRQRVLGQVARGAAVRDHDFLGRHGHHLAPRLALMLLLAESAVDSHLAVCRDRNASSNPKDGCRWNAAATPASTSGA